MQLDRVRSAFWAALCGSVLLYPSDGVADNPVQRENGRPGTAGWFLADEASGQIEGYASATSVHRGEQISLYVRTSDPSYVIEVFRLGWYGGVGARRMAGPISRGGSTQVIPPPDALGMVECNWSDPYVLSIPAPSDSSEWASGLYVARLTGSSGKQKFIPFVVRDDARSSNYYFISSTNTAQAYNAWGGKSLYAYNSTGGDPARKVSYNRPYDDGGGTGQVLSHWEYNMVRFLEREGYDVAYGTDVDLARRGSLLTNHRAVLLVGHPEYWSWEMRANVESARDSGVHLGWFSANSCYWQIRFEPGSTGSPDRTIVAYKDAAATEDPFATDTLPENDDLVTTHWRDPPVNRPEAALVGVQYFFDPVDADIVIDDTESEPWVFAGTSLTSGDRLQGLLGYEADEIVPGSSPPGIVRLGHSPFSTTATMPSRGSNRSRNSRAVSATEYADMTVYTAASGAVVFSTGSMHWNFGLDDWNAISWGNRLNGNAQQITRNVLRRFAGTSVGSVRFAAATYSVDESASSLVVAVRRENGVAGPLTVSYAATGGSATAGSDFTAVTGTLSWGDGETDEKTVSVPVVDDSIVEAPETFTLTLSNVSPGGTLGTPASATVTIQSDDAYGAVQFSAASYSVVEGKGSATLTATRTGGRSGSIGVSYATSDGTAIAGSDYTTAAGTLVWADGETAPKTFDVQIADDASAEGSETLNVSLSAPTGGATLGSPATVTLSIADNGSFQFGAAAYVVSEGGGAATVVVTRTELASEAMSVGYATANGTAVAESDYSANSGTLQFAAGETSKTLDVAIIDDEFVEPDETLTVGLSAPGGDATVGTPGVATVRIVSDDSYGSLQFSAATFNVSEGVAAVLTVTRTGGVSGSVGVTYETFDGSATAGSDYAASTGTLTWVHGESASKSITISVSDDRLVEADETLTVVLRTPTGGAAIGSPDAVTISIENNDAYGTLQLSAATVSVSEGAATAAVSVTRTGGDSGAIGVSYSTADGSATAGSDYGAVAGTLNWADGETSAKVFNVPIIEDGASEGSETIAILLSAPTGGATLGTPATGTLTIADNGSFQFARSTYEVSESAASVTMTVIRTEVTTAAMSVAYAMAEGTATAGSDYTSVSGTLNFEAGESSRTFTISIHDDADSEPDETLEVMLLTPTGGAGLSTPDRSTVIVFNDDGVTPVSSLDASATSSTQVRLVWPPARGASRYNVYRLGTGLLGSASTASYLDSQLSPNAAYVYYVEAVNGGDAVSPPSPLDLATTVLFADDPLVPRATPIRAQHVLELRQAVNAVRTAAGLASFAFTDPVLAGVPVRAIHFGQLRAALAEARSRIGLTSVTYTYSATPETIIRAVDIEELRNGIR